MNKERGTSRKLDKEKMKILKKINKGLILTIIVVLALTIYLMGVEKQRKADKKEIQKVCEEFVELTNKYSVLPEEMQTLTKEIPESQVKEYLSKMRSEIKDKMIQNEEAIEIQCQILENNLRNGYNEQEIKTNLNREITKISNYEFDKDQVTVTFKSIVETSSKYLNGEEEQVKQNSFNSAEDEIILQKVDGKWKIVYSNLQYNEYGMYYTDTIML